MGALAPGPAYVKSLGVLERLPRNPTILCIGAHCDDIEIGCGAAMLRILRTRRDVSVRWVVLSSTAERGREAAAAAALFLRAARSRTVQIESFTDGHFPYQGAEIKHYFEQLKSDTPPDLIFTHYRDDRHQDHRVVSDTTWQTFRDATILEYEIPKWDGDLGSPNVFVEIDSATCERKIRYLTRCYVTQRTKPWFTAETLRSLMRLRAVESRAPRYAEAFYGRKLVF
jgi:LmbE family N-acetylglucosaminyl deacetylase